MPDATTENPPATAAAATTETPKSTNHIVRDSAFWQGVEEAVGKSSQDQKPDEKAETTENKDETKPAPTDDKAGDKSSTEKPADKLEVKTEDKADPKPAKKKPVLTQRGKSDADSAKMVTTAATTAATAAVKAAMDNERTHQAATQTASNKPAAAFGADDLPDDLAADFDTFTEMGNADPKKYGKLVDKIVDFATTKEPEYIKAWSKENPGKKFDADDSEHDEFYAENRPAWSQKDFKLAERAVFRKEAQADFEQKMRPELQKAEQLRREQEIAPIANTLVGQATEFIAKAVDPAIDTPEKMRADPVAEMVIMAEAKRANSMIRTALALDRGTAQFDPKNPVHDELFRIASDAEKQLAQLPDENQLDDDGRMFVTREQFAKMSHSDRQRHWYLDENHLAVIITEQSARRAKGAYKQQSEYIDKMAEKRGYKKSDAGGKNGNGTNPSPNGANGSGKESDKSGSATAAPAAATSSPSFAAQGAVGGPVNNKDTGKNERFTTFGTSRS